MPYLYTNITTWIGDVQVTGYNIGGYTCICMDDLAAHFADEYVWSPADKALYMTSPAISAPPATGETELNAAEAAVAAYITKLVADEEAGIFTDEETAMLAEYEALLGQEFIEELFAVSREFGDTISYTITGSVVEQETATVNITVSCRDLSSAMAEYTARLLTEIFLAGMRGEELTEAQYFQLSMQLMFDVIGDDTLPPLTTETVVYLDLIDEVWVVNEETSLDFLNALSGGILSDPLFSDLPDDDNGHKLA